MIIHNYLINLFGIIGFKIGKYPLISIGIFILINILPALIGFFIGIKSRIGLDEGFLPLNSPSKLEITAQKNFFEKTEKSKEWYMALFGINNSGINGNLLELNNYKELKSFYERIFNNITINNITYSQICHPFCDINDQFFKLMEYSDSFLRTLGQIKFSYPISKILNYNINIGKVSK
ncbi:Patched domain-containing protein 3 [Meloidogyne graminicola]|uniref:Patched domain-containing protein 3 n=1 Tax=Meloidogyne graminicola TaxID=189291 RepID=A0A8S9ZXD1_9BILA|nr:Patched domain-containing protein 3 [Meloidogyne graminicola]